jgi:hypothetical protein
MRGSGKRPAIDRMSAFRQVRTSAKHTTFAKREGRTCSPVFRMATQTRQPDSVYDIYRERSAFAVALMIPERRDCEGGCRSGCIAILFCDAVARYRLHFSRNSLPPGAPIPALFWLEWGNSRGAGGAFGGWDDGGLGSAAV